MEALEEAAVEGMEASEEAAVAGMEALEGGVVEDLEALEDLEVEVVVDTEDLALEGAAVEGMGVDGDQEAVAVLEAGLAMEVTGRDLWKLNIIN